MKYLTVCACEQGLDTLLALLENPFLVPAANSFKAIPERKFSVSEESGPDRSKWVYVFQREYVTVDPAFVDVSNFPSLFYFIRKISITSNVNFPLPPFVTWKRWCIFNCYCTWFFNIKSVYWSIKLIIFFMQAIQSLLENFFWPS